MNNRGRNQMQFVQVQTWPPLAWLARCPKDGGPVTVFHGSRVEVNDEWFCEAVWAGSYADGGFDETDVVAGSGGRRRDGTIVFVSSGSTVDRLQSLQTEKDAWVSNSLSCLLSASGAKLDRTSTAYFRLLRSVVAGLVKYKRFIQTSLGPIQLTYFDNLVWNGHSLTVRPKPGLGRDFSSFDKYHGFLRSSIQGVAENMTDGSRAYPYEFLSTASSGYDSSTITVLAKQAGCRKVLCIDQARRKQDDSGLPLAGFLGLDAVEVSRDAWKSQTYPEMPFIAADSHGGDVFFKGAESILAGKVLLTGYHGDKMWEKVVHNDEHIVRGDQSGLSLTDYRLAVGMIHCPPTFWGVRQIAEINAISLSPEMAPWDVPGDYSRPICRRIVEGAGVPREMFGMQKKASWVTLIRDRSFLSEPSMQHYIEWLRANRSEWLKRGRVPPLLSPRVDNLGRKWRMGLKKAVDAQTGWRLKALQKSGARRAIARVAETPPKLRRHLFAWAVEHHSKAYGPPI